MRFLNQLLTLTLLTLALATPLASAETPEGTLNLNQASAEQLQLLPRVGPSLAGKILEFRETNGDFRSVDELVAVKGIGEKSLDAMRPWLSLEGDTTLAEKVRLPRASATDEEAATSED